LVFLFFWPLHCWFSVRFFPPNSPKYQQAIKTRDVWQSQQIYLPIGTADPKLLRFGIVLVLISSWLLYPFYAHCCTFQFFFYSNNSVFAFIRWANIWVGELRRGGWYYLDRWVHAGDRFPNRLTPQSVVNKASSPVFFPSRLQQPQTPKAKHALKRQYCLLSCLRICKMHTAPPPRKPPSQLPPVRANWA